MNSFELYNNTKVITKQFLGNCVAAKSRSVPPALAIVDGSDSDGSCIASSAAVCPPLPADSLPLARSGGGGSCSGLIGDAGLLSAAPTAADSSDLGEDVQDFIAQSLSIGE